MTKRAGCASAAGQSGAHHGQGERERASLPRRGRRHRRADHRLCVGAQGFPGAGVRAGGGIQGARSRHPARAQHLPRDRAGRAQGRHDGRCLGAARDRDARRAQRPTRHRHSARRALHAALRPALCGDPSGRHPRCLSRACQGDNLVSLENNRKVDDFVDARRCGGDPARRRRGGPRPRADRLRRYVVADPRPQSSATAPRACPATSPIALCSGATRCPTICGGPTWCCGPGRRPISSIIRCAAARSTISSPCSIPTAMWRAGTPSAIPRSCSSASRASAPRCCGSWSASRPGGCGCCATASR